MENNCKHLIIIKTSAQNTIRTPNDRFTGVRAQARFWPKLVVLELKTEFDDDGERKEFLIKQHRK
jgi:hypothetical protein